MATSNRIFGPKSLHTFETAELEAWFARPSFPSLTERRRKELREVGQFEDAFQMGASRLETFRRNLDLAAAEAGLTIHEVPMRMPAANPLASPLAKARVELRLLQGNVLRGLVMVSVMLAGCTIAALCDDEWTIAALIGTLTLACIPLAVMTYQAQASEVR